MLHKLELPDDAELRSIMAFQRDLLSFACSPALSRPFDRSEVDRFFGGRSDWLWSRLLSGGKATSLSDKVSKVNDLIRETPSLAKNILDAYDNDASFDLNTTNPDFVFQFPDLSDNVQESVGDLLIGFYDWLATEAGYPDRITARATFSRHIFVRRFFERNVAIKVCPGCNGKRPDRIGVKIHADADHYFPKAVYPCLSVHPLNLVPMCLDCNRTFKGERNALVKARLSELFVPFVREALGPLKVCVSRNAVAMLTVNTLEADGTATSPRIEALEYILRLQARWSTRLQDSVSSTIHTHLGGQRRLWRRYSTPLVDIKAGLAATRDEYRAKSTKIENGVLFAAYIDFALQDSAELEYLVSD